MRGASRHHLLRFSVIVVGLCSSASASATLPAFDGTALKGDFDGDGDEESVVTSPEHDCGKGAVYVRTGTTVVTWTRDTPGILGVATCGDRFGAAAAVGDFNADGYDDIAVGAPGASDSGVTASGSVHVIYGSSTGLTDVGDQLWHQDTFFIADVAEVNDNFGEVLSVGDFDCSGADDLAIGIPREDASSRTDVGAVAVLYADASGLSYINDLFVQNTGGVSDTPEVADYFGASLAVGNFNGDIASGNACADLAVGVPGENIGSIADAGLVHLFHGATVGLDVASLQVLHQDVTGVVDVAEANDAFGTRLRSADAQADGYDDLLVVVPGDACSNSIGVGEHSFNGGQSGITVVGNAISCFEYNCTVSNLDAQCMEPTVTPVYGTSGDNDLWMWLAANVAFGLDGDDTFSGGVGDQYFFGGPGADQFDGGPGADFLIGGDGDDSFHLDLDCDAQPGEVIDGGPGFDTVYSSLTQGQLLAAGVQLESIESFTLIPAGDPSDADGCSLVSFIGNSVAAPWVTIDWTELPTPSSEYSTTSGILHLSFTNSGPVGVDVAPVLRLHARGATTTLVPTAMNLPPNQATTVEIDLNDFIPNGVDPNGLPSYLLKLPASASLIVTAKVSFANSTDVAETAVAPRIFGHLDGSTAILYGEERLHSTYRGGDLAGIDSGLTGPSRIQGRTEAIGTLGITPP